MRRVTFGFLVVTIACMAAPAAVQAARQVLHSEMTHLRGGDEREWSSFPKEASGSSLTVRFDARANETPATLGLRRIDVKHGWQVRLNDKTLGRLSSDENDMDEVWELEPGTLRDGENELLVEAIGDRADDVLIGEVWLDPRSREEVFSEARVQLVARDAAGNAIPCRFTILNEKGSLATVGAESNDQLAVRVGVVYSSTGRAEIGLASESYTIFCGRGFEYSLDQTELVVDPEDEKRHEFTLTRVVDTAGLVACDPHVHTFEISRHGDASLDERMITLAGEGIELPVATDHNIFVDYRPYLRRLGLADAMTPLIGNEVTTKYGHFNIFPAEVDAPLPDHQAGSWEALFDSIDGIPNVRVAILNHPRDVHSGFTPFGPENMISAVGERLDDRTLQANAVELINSAALQSDPMVVFHDWLTQANRGHSLTAVGSSDSHEVSRKIVGQGRSYIYVDDTDPGSIDVDAAVESFVNGRVLVSFGLLTELMVDGAARSGDVVVPENDTVEVTVRVQGPEWVQADRVELYANGERIRSAKIPAEKRDVAGVKATVRWQIDTPSHDVHFVALARGPGVTGLHWPTAKPYQPTSPDWEPYAFGSSGVVRLDVDGDGKWTSAKEYADQAVAAADGEFTQLAEALDEYDASTAAFAAHQWIETGGQIRDAAARQRLKAASEAVQRGFEKYIRSQRTSLEARH